ncbi:transposase [Mycobacterium sp. ML4]
MSVGAAAMEPRQPHPTDIIALPRRYRTWLPLTGLTAHQFDSVHTRVSRQARPSRGRPWVMPLPIRLLLVLIHLRTNLTTRALAALFTTSHPTVDRVLHHLVPILANTLEHDTIKTPDGPWIIDATLIPVHDQSIAAISKNYRRSINTQILVDAHSRAVIAVGAAWPGNRNDVIAARHTLAHMLTGDRIILADGGYRGIGTITGPRRDKSGRTIRDDHNRVHRRIHARVEHVLARLKAWQIHRHCHRRGHAINHSLHIITRLWNLNNHNHLRVNS